MDIQDFLDGVREHLCVTWLVITPREGGRIDVGEEFDVQLSVRNTFDGDSLPGFKDVELLIRGTDYAEPTGDSQLRITGRLGPGESVNRVVRFRALDSDPSTEGGPQQEPIADVRVRARLDMEAVLDIESKPRLLRTQIYGGAHRE
jgi:hypothetical protein